MMVIAEVAGDISIKKARFLNDDEKKSYNPEVRDYMMRGCGEIADLSALSWRGDMPKREDDGCFEGASSRCWIINDSEAEDYIALNKERENAARKKKLAGYIDSLEKSIATAKKQKDLPSREEAKRRMKTYNNTVNEGGEGYVPHIITKEEYEDMQKQLRKYKNEMISL